MKSDFRIALVTCRHVFDYKYEEVTNSLAHFENLGVGYIAALLNRHAFDVTIFNESLEALDRGELLSALRTGGYRLVGFSVNSANVFEALEVAGALSPASHRCFGGYQASLFPDDLLAYPQVDSVIIGEAEVPFLELAEALAKDRDFENILNLRTKRTRNRLRRLAEPDTLPFPSRREIAAYYKKMEKSPRPPRRVALVSASRGCLGNCSFCYAKKFYSLAPGPCIRQRNPVLVADEIEALVRGPLQIEFIWFVDEEFIGGREDRVRSFIAEMERRKLCVPFEFDCRTDSVDENLFAELKNIGLRRVFLGVESFSQSFLDRQRKGIHVRTNCRAIEILEKLDIRYRLGMIFFDAQTSLQEICENVENCYRLGFEHINDPGRALKKYSGRGMEWELPEDDCVRSIFERLHAEIHRVFSFPGPVTLETLVEKKQEIGHYFWKLVLAQQQLLLD